MIEEINITSIILSIVSSLLVLITAILSIYLTNKHAEKKFEKERKERIMADLVSSRLKAFQEVNSNMVNCFFKLNQYGNNNPQTMHIFKNEVGVPKDKFEDILNINSIWFSPNLSEQLNKVRGAFRQVSFAIYLRLPSEELPEGTVVDSYPPEIKNINWEQFNNSFNRAKEMIREEMGIVSLEKYIKEIVG